MIDWIKKKILNKKFLGCGIAVLLILFLGVNYFFRINTGMWFWERAIYQPLSEEEIQERIPALTRSYPDVVKGNWEPNASFMHKMILKDADELKALGLNTVSAAVEYEFNKDGTHFMRDGDEEEIRSNVVLAKEEGFAVWLAVSFVGGGDIKSYREKGIDITLEKYLEVSNEVALKWAKVAEEFNVEYFGPQNELDYMISINFEDDGAERSRIFGGWYKQILPRVREVYSGKVIAKFAWVEETIPETASDYTGYDYVGMAISHGSNNLEDYRLHVKEQYKRITSIALGSNSEWMVLEAWHPFGVALFETNVDGESLDELQDDYYKVSVEEYLQIKEDKPAGYVFWSWIMPGANVKGRDAEDVLKEFFSEL
jgi:hypothetical protein